MDWKTIHFDWNHARAFLVTSEEGSLSAAARALGMSQPTLGRQVTALEQQLDVALFERVGRGLVLTPGGAELLEHVRVMGDAANRVSMSASGQSQSIEGRICITASEVHAAYLLPPIIARLRRVYPGIQIEIIASNSPSDLARREADIAIRSFRPTQPDLIARKIKEVAARLYATPAYLNRLSNPRTPADFSAAEFIDFDDSDRLLNALNGMGLALTRKNFPIQTENHLVQWAFVKAGLGIGFMPEDIADGDARVQQVLPSLEPIVFPIWLTSHRDLKTSRRIRLVFDILAAELA